MSDTHVPDKPLLHPVLTLRKNAVKREAPSGGKRGQTLLCRACRASERRCRGRSPIFAQLSEIANIFKSNSARS